MKLSYAGWHDAVGIEVVRRYLESVQLVRDYNNVNQDPVYSVVSIVCQVLFFLFAIRYLYYVTFDSTVLEVAVLYSI